MSRVLILIPCSGSKREERTMVYSPDDSILNYLTDSSKEHLLRLRRELFKYFSIPFGRDVGYHNDEIINYMEAYERYTGKYSQIYRQISSSSWNKLKKSKKLDLIIISALYGILKYAEPIRWYNKTMKNKINNQTLKTWWGDNGLCTILENYIDKNDISEVHNVLSNDYNEALGRCFMHLEVEYSYHNFSVFKSGSNAHRGKWVENFIQEF